MTRSCCSDNLVNFTPGTTKMDPRRIDVRSSHPQQRHTSCFLENCNVTSEERQLRHWGLHKIPISTSLETKSPSGSCMRLRMDNSFSWTSRVSFLWLGDVCSLGAYATSRFLFPACRVGGGSHRALWSAKGPRRSLGLGRHLVFDCRTMPHQE